MQQQLISVASSNSAYHDRNPRSFAEVAQNRVQGGICGVNQWEETLLKGVWGRGSGGKAPAGDLGVSDVQAEEFLLTLTEQGPRPPSYAPAH